MSFLYWQWHGCFGSSEEAELSPKINNGLRGHIYFDFSPIGIL